ncbi:MAG: hypothetical protein ACKVQB_07100, partial [Bacteroidia bacterium]
MEKSINNLKNEEVKGEGIMGGGNALGGGPHVPPPIVHNHPTPDAGPTLNSDGSVINDWDAGVIMPDDGGILPDAPIGG